MNRFGIIYMAYPILFCLELRSIQDDFRFLMVRVLSLTPRFIEV
jgi:hypothetical protein